MRKIKIAITIVAFTISSCNGNKIEVGNFNTNSISPDSSIKQKILKIETINLEKSYGIPPKEYNEIQKLYKKENELNIIVSNIYGVDSLIFFNIDTKTFIEEKNIYLPYIGDTLALYTTKNEILKFQVYQIDYCDSLNIELLSKYNGTMNCDFGYFAGSCKLLPKQELKKLIPNTVIDVLFKYQNGQKFKSLDISSLTKRSFTSKESFVFDFQTKKWKDTRQNIFELSEITVFHLINNTYFIIQRSNEEFTFIEIYKIEKNEKLKLVYTYPIE